MKKINFENLSNNTHVKENVENLRHSINVLIILYVLL